MILNQHYRRSETETQLRTFVKENPDADHVGIGLISDILSPIWRGSLYIVIAGTDNDVELRINKLWKSSPSFKFLKRAGVTAVQINADDVAKVRPLLDGLKIVHEGRVANDALLAVLPLLK